MTKVRNGFKGSVEGFFAGYERKFEPLTAVRTPGTPSPMVIGPVPDSPGWVYWRLYPWSTQRDIFQDVERGLSFQFPETYKIFLTMFHTLSLDLGFVRFPDTPMGSEEQRLRELLGDEQASVALERALLPFAWGGGGSSLLCFDRTLVWSEDTRIVSFREVGSEFVQEPVATTFGRYLDACAFFLRSEVDFLAISEDSPPAEERTPIFEDFLSLDPEGMAKLGRPFWLEVAGL
jgi:hypothetical protein